MSKAPDDPNLSQAGPSQQDDEGIDSLNQVIIIGPIVHTDEISTNQRANYPQLSQHNIVVDDDQNLQSIESEYDATQVDIPIYSILQTKLQPKQVEDILDNIDHSRITKHVPYTSESGHVYLFNVGSNAHAGRATTRQDGYSWVSMGSSKMGKKEHLRQTKFYLRVEGRDPPFDRAFARYEFYSDRQPEYLLVQYIGDINSCESNNIEYATQIAGDIVAEHKHEDNKSIPIDYHKYTSGMQIDGGALLYEMHPDGPNVPLKQEEAFTILQEVDATRLSPEPPVMPNGGMMFLYDISSNPKVLRAKFRCDQYQFASRGCRLNVNLNMIKGHHFIRCGRARNDFDRSFQRHEYWLKENPTYMLVHYVGDHTVWRPRPHGNAKNSTQPYVRTRPEVLQAIKLQSSELDSNVVYDRTMSMLVRKENIDEGIPLSKLPRNRMQVMNHRRGIRSRRIEQDILLAQNLKSEDDEQFVLEDGTHIDSSRIVKLYDGTFALIPDDNDKSAIDADSNFGDKVRPSSSQSAEGDAKVDTDQLIYDAETQLNRIMQLAQNCHYAARVRKFINRCADTKTDEDLINLLMHKDNYESMQSRSQEEYLQAKRNKTEEWQTKFNQVKKGG